MPKSTSEEAQQCWKYRCQHRTRRFVGSLLPARYVIRGETVAAAASKSPRRCLGDYPKNVPGLDPACNDAVLEGEGSVHAINPPFGFRASMARTYRKL